MANAKTKKARKEYPKTDAGKSERFKDFANTRVNRALASLGAVGKLSNVRAYKYNADQVAKIRTALEKELARVFAAFENPGTAKDGGFTL